MKISHIRFNVAVPVPGLSGTHLQASVNNGVEIVREGDVVRLTAGTTVYVPFAAVAYFVADEQPAAKPTKRGAK